jgi:hypothetical protein
MKRALVVALLLWPALARAQDLKDRFNFRLSLSSMYMTEQQAGLPSNKIEIGPLSLAYGDLRLVLDGRRLPGNFEMHFDGRVRITGEVDQAGLDAGAGGDTARGYLGGREYQLYQWYVLHRGESVDFSFGRQVVLEADAMRIDGIRLWYRFAKPHWDLSFFAGGYPNPYSRSLTTDYQYSALWQGSPSGYLGAPIGGGADASYVYDKFWGSLAVAYVYTGGNDDGGPLDPLNVTANYQRENARSFINWVGFERFTSWLDVYHNLVVDMTGAGGAQFTRLDLFATARAGKHFTIMLGYDHLSAIAVEMFLNNLLQNRLFLSQNGITVLPSITNNLLIERTGRDQVRGNLDAHWGLVNIWAEGRFRVRSLINTGVDPQFIGPNGVITLDGANLAGDATFGIRDLGTLKKLRLGVWYTYLNDYRSQSHIAALNMGRGFYDERLTFDFSFLYARTRDNGVTAAQMMTQCPGGFGPPAVQPVCYGTRDGSSYELDFTFTGNPWKHWFVFLEYQMVANLSADELNPTGAPSIITHVFLGRIEVRY